MRRAAALLIILLLAVLSARLFWPAARPGSSRPHALPLSGTAAMAVTGGPSLNSAMVDGILNAYGSPLRGHGAELTALSRRYRIDDAVALAFFVMESRAGTEGEAVLTHSFGNLRPRPGQPQLDGYRLYSSWMDSAGEWFSLMRSYYVDSLGLRTLRDIVPIYAPSGDSNNPPEMIAGIEQLVSCWRGDTVRCPDSPAAVHELVAAATSG